jgi:hypothetical protein
VSFIWLADKFPINHSCTSELPCYKQRVVEANSRSGAVDGRPTSEDNFPNCGDVFFRISSTILGSAATFDRLPVDSPRNVTEHSFLLVIVIVIVFAPFHKSRWPALTGLAATG